MFLVKQQQLTQHKNLKHKYMGAYSNPQIPIDTQSGQYYRDLTNTIVSNTVGIINDWAAKAAENKKKNQAIAIKVGEEESAMNRFVGDAQIKNPTVDFETLYRPMIKEYAKLKTSILNGTSANPSEDRRISDEIFSSVKNIQETLIDISSTDFIPAFKNMNGPGGLDGSANQPEVVEALAIFHGLQNGKKVPVREAGGKISWDIYNADNKLVKKFTSQEIKDSSKNGMLFIVPNAAENVDSFKIANPTIFEQKDGQPTGIITAGFLNDAVEYKIQDKSVQDTLGYTKKTAIYGKKQAINKKKIEDDPNFIAMVDSKACGMTDSTFSGREAILFNNNHFKNQPGAIYLDPTKAMTEEEKTKFKADYKKFILDGIPNEQVVPGYKPVEKEEIVEVKAKTTGSKGGGTNTNKGKGKGKSEDKPIDQISKEIYAIKADTPADEWKYGNRKISWSAATGEFKVKTSGGDADAIFKTKQEVIDYLKGGKTKLN
jgi:hypothetical protein